MRKLDEIGIFLMGAASVALAILRAFGLLDGARRHKRRRAAFWDDFDLEREYLDLLARHAQDE